MDGWTSVQNISYLGITCHFVDNETKFLVSAVLDTVLIEKLETIKHIVSEVISEWGIDGKVKCIVTDNAANMVKAVDLLGISLASLIH